MKLLKKFENIFAAAAFAEAGEFETARQMAKEDDEASKTTVGKKDHTLQEERPDANHYPSRA